MKNLGLQEIRREFLNFFEGKGHLTKNSYSLIPQNDKSLLLIGAGMAPLKKYFTGELVPPRTRMATCQKCVRTGDIDNVGKTARHATFFEMLGNFSFGDYFKREAITWAWEFLTVNLELPEDKLWVTVYKDDDEAFEIWENVVGIPKERIVRLGKEDNFWELEVGPSGPCSEIYVDRGEEYGCGDPDCKPGCECDRFLEVWNLVFTQFDKDENGEYHPLEHKNIDTGMGLERITAVMENADNIFEIRAIQDIIRKIEEVSSYKYKTDPKKDVSIRVITDHVRAMTFMISDTIIPGNEGRGYVLRRMIRRASRHGRLIGIEKPFLSEIAQVVIDAWSVDYKDLKENESKIKTIILNEENKFNETLEQGTEILEGYIKELLESKQDTLSGDKAFKLYDTYGFPLELTEEILKENNLKIDEEKFQQEMESQKERARSNRTNKDNIGWSNQSEHHQIDFGETEFLGYETLNTEGKVKSILVENEEKEQVSEGKCAVITDRTSFYGESGGQIGDTGEIKNKDFEGFVYDTKKTKAGTILHLVEIKSGELKLCDTVELKVDAERRRAIRRNHSATHLLHKALRTVLGDHVNQAGSEVTDKSFRFDFTHYKPVSQEELKKIEKLVNEYIYTETPSDIYEKSIEDAFSEGAIGLFEDKYKSKVRVVNFPNISKELCGGTHVDKTSDIGIFKIMSEYGIASGVRRIEAITGESVYKYLKDLQEVENSIEEKLKTDKSGVNSKLSSILEENKVLSKEIHDLKNVKLKSGIDEIIKTSKNFEGINIVYSKTEAEDVESMRNLADEIRNRLENSVVVLGAVNGEKVNLVTAVSKDLIKKGLKAGIIIKEVAKIVDGNGGGRPDMATAGGKNPKKLDEALEKVYDIVTKNYSL